jgi:hypothetical protein
MLEGLVGHPQPVVIVAVLQPRRLTHLDQALPGVSNSRDRHQEPVDETEGIPLGRHRYRGGRWFVAHHPDPVPNCRTPEEGIYTRPSGIWVYWAREQDHHPVRSRQA